MTAYAIFIREKMVDPAEVENYKSLVGASMAGHAVTRLAAYGHHEVFEGAAMEGVVVLSFPTFDEAKAWYTSPAYLKAREHRFLGAQYRVVIVEGV